VMVTDLAAVEVMDTKLTHAFVYFVSLAADAFVGERLVRLRFPR
jgi:hypothetical protein